MRAWKIGAVIGGIIGFSLNRSVTMLTVGAFFGSFLGQIYVVLSSSKASLRKKGMIIGALWGVVSFFGGLNLTCGGYGDTCSVINLNLGKSIILLPHLILIYLTNLFHLWGSSNPEAAMAGLFLVPFVLLFDVLFGSIIGFVFASLIEKYKQRRVTL